MEAARAGYECRAGLTDPPFAGSGAGLALGQVLAGILAARAQGAEGFDGALWNRGYCPIGGGWPDLALLPMEQGERTLVCARCAAVITHQGHAIRMHNRHVHAFFNPAGIAFELRCFQKAPGAAPCGQPSAEFTWFPGYCWQTVFCTNCQAHLGWLFSNTDRSFFGLISSSLR